jgi:hypothetical protein
MKKIEFETFRDLNNTYSVSQLKQEEPSNVNFLNYRKYKITIELVEESNETLLARLEDLLKKSTGYNKIERVKKVISHLKSKM